MQRNVEIKAVVSDLAAVLKRASELSDLSYAYRDGGMKIEQTDTFFNSSNGRVKLRRLKTEVNVNVQMVHQNIVHWKIPKLIISSISEPRFYCQPTMGRTHEILRVDLLRPEGRRRPKDVLLQEDRCAQPR